MRATHQSSSGRSCPLKDLVTAVERRHHAIPGTFRGFSVIDRSLARLVYMATASTIDSVDGSDDEAAWDRYAACREPDAPSMFVDDWGVGRAGRRCRATALACCRRCVVRWECGRRALAEVEDGLCLYGVRCGIEFTDVTPSRQQRDIERLYAVVASLQSSNIGHANLTDAQQAVARATLVKVGRKSSARDATALAGPDDGIALRSADRRPEPVLRAG
jgi:hypothetical protein